MTPKIRDYAWRHGDFRLEQTIKLDYELMRRLAAWHGVKLTFADTYLVELNGLDAYVNRSTHSLGEITIGLYESSELRLLSFFHELGHCVDKGPWDSKYEQERRAWELGYALAEKESIDFSKSARAWAMCQLRTYEMYR